MYERVSTVSWSGGMLPDEAFDSFTIMVHLPNSIGPFFFPTVQQCGDAQTRWVDMPPAGKTTRRAAPTALRHPDSGHTRRQIMQAALAFNATGADRAG
jgi:uncharacterized protein YcnI